MFVVDASKSSFLFSMLLFLLLLGMISKLEGAEGRFIILCR